MDRILEHLKYISALVFILLVTITCTEPFEFEVEEFENILVVEARLTDEVKIQSVLLSRSFLEDDEVIQVSGASVRVVDNSGTEYEFQEARIGLYESAIEFGAVPGRDYILQITTSTGSYSSTVASLPTSAEINDIQAIRTTDEFGVDGVAILVDGTGQNGESGFFQYTYEETYRVVSPFRATERLIEVSSDPPMLELIINEREERVCYATQFSNSFALTSTEGLSENRVSKFQVRFIPRTDRVIADRYSILVKQYSQSREANTFYNTLQEFSNIESLFFQTQPGFVVGNVSATTNPEEKVLGLFEVASVAEKRLFFDFNDIFPTENPFSPFCENTRVFNKSDPGLYNLITGGGWRFLSTDPLDASQMTYILLQARCIDCTLFGTNIKPDFWED